MTMTLNSNVSAVRVNYLFTARGGLASQRRRKNERHDVMDFYCGHYGLVNLVVGKIKLLYVLDAPETELSRTCTEAH